MENAAKKDPWKVRSTRFIKGLALKRGGRLFFDLSGKRFGFLSSQERIA